jgi:hypothetical protein
MATHCSSKRYTCCWLPLAALSLVVGGCGQATAKKVAPNNDVGGQVVDTISTIVDAGVTITDAGTTVIDAGSTVTDAGIVAIDADISVVDAGTTIIDAGVTIIDAGPTIIDAGPAIVDAGPAVIDAGPIGPNQCSSEQPCKKAMCTAPGAFIGCGMCNKAMPGCKSDKECSAKKNGICVFKKTDCTCDSIKLCHVGCGNDGQCKTGEVCAADHHCKAKSCTTSTDCPKLFACSKSATCQRKNCAKSAECGSAAYCVNKKCYGQPGNCQFPPA